MLHRLSNPMYWDRKVRLLILTVATFLSLC
jgi:hypothetical protein